MGHTPPCRYQKRAVAPGVPLISWLPVTHWSTTQQTTALSNHQQTNCLSLARCWLLFGIIFALASPTAVQLHRKSCCTSNPSTPLAHCCISLATTPLIFTPALIHVNHCCISAHHSYSCTSLPCCTHVRYTQSCAVRYTQGKAATESLISSSAGSRDTLVTRARGLESSNAELRQEIKSLQNFLQVRQLLTD